jgi:hypothetical protein
MPIRFVAKQGICTRIFPLFIAGLVPRFSAFGNQPDRHDSFEGPSKPHRSSFGTSCAHHARNTLASRQWVAIESPREPIQRPARPAVHPDGRPIAALLTTSPVYRRERAAIRHGQRDRTHAVHRRNALWSGLGAVDGGKRHHGQQDDCDHCQNSPDCSLIFHVRGVRSLYRNVVICLSRCQSELLALTCPAAACDSGVRSLKNSAWPSAKLSP